MVLITVLSVWLCMYYCSVIGLLQFVLFCSARVLLVCLLVSIVLSFLPLSLLLLLSLISANVLDMFLIMIVPSHLISFSISFTTFDGLHPMDLLIHERLYHYVVSVATFLPSSYLVVVDHHY